MRVQLPVILIWLVFLGPGFAPARAQSLAEGSPSPPEVKMSLNKTTLLISESLNLTIIIKGFNLPDLEPPQWPEIPGFIQVDQSSSVIPSNVGGKRYVLSRFVCSYIPKESGISWLPSIQVSFPGVKFKSQPVQLKVLNQDLTENTRPLAPSAAAELTPASGNLPDIPKNDQMRIVAEVSNTTPFRGEQVILTYKLLTSVGVGRKIEQVKRPEFKQFWTESVPIKPEKMIETIVVKGLVYYQIMLDQMVLFPTTSGVLPIEPAIWKVIAKFESPLYHEEQRTLQAPALTLNVRALPPDPTGHAGDQPEVGTYHISLNLQSTKVKIGQAFPLYLTVKGFGNIRGLLPPKLPETPDFSVVSVRPVHSGFAPSVDTSTDRPKISFGGEKVWEILIYPKRLGDVVFPTVHYDYFDNDRTAYRRLDTAPVVFRVENVENRKAEQAEQDGKGASEPLSFIPLAILLVLAATLCGMLLIVVRQRRTMSRGSPSRRKTASVESLLKEAEEMATHRGAEAFFDVLLNSIYLMFQQMTGTPIQAMTREELMDVMKRSGNLSDDVCAIFSVLDSCDVARFADVRFEVQERKEMLVKARLLYQNIRARKFAPVG